jgi:elongation factor P
MAQVSTNEFRPGVKVEFEGQPYLIVTNEFVKPGKGQAFNRVRLKHLISGRTVDKTFKSGEKLDLADVVETQMRMLYRETDGIVFMDDNSFEQIKIAQDKIGETDKWMLEDKSYEVMIYNGDPVAVEPPTFMELKIVQTDPGVRGDTASGRVMKPATLESGATIQIPIFVEEGEIIKVDTRTSEYVSRIS